MVSGDAHLSSRRQERPALILASASPRRRELLARAELSFTVHPADVDETPPAGVEPRDLALLLARRKAACVAETFPDALVLGVDTVVDHAGQVLGKPRDPLDAVAMLTLLQGRRHAVHTGMALVGRSRGVAANRVVTALVTMRPLTPEEIATYVASGEPLDKAGSYGIQGLGGALISDVEGSRLAVVGLPVDDLLPMLHDAGIT